MARSITAANGVMLRLCARPATHSKAMPTPRCVLKANNTSTANHTAPASTMVCAARNAKRCELSTTEPTKPPKAKLAPSQPRPVWSVR